MGAQYFFSQGVPYVAVMMLSTVMYKNLGISNADLAFYTAWLYLPWVVKPLWSPVVEMFGTKRRWIVLLQLSGAALAAVALTLHAPDFFRWTLVIFWLMAFSSATHDIASDGFYMLGLPTSGSRPRLSACAVRSTSWQ
jgi:PAT family beta-lactamase induction signal transducer AmpG